ncbi:MAG TPA: aldehyde dehydrogenase family protein [Ktedonobacterales bacterium]
MTHTYKNYIKGRWVAAHSGATFEDRNPANGELIGLFPRSGQKDVDDAVAAARAAFTSWRLTPAPKRGEILFRFGQLLRERKDDVARSMTQEMGKVLKEAGGDVQEGIDMAFYMGGEGRRLFGFVTPVELPNKSGMAVRDPIGVVGVITPWNFPIAIPSWKILAALICGNTIVFKPAKDTPLCAVKFVELLEEAGLPAGVVNLVHGSGPEVGLPIVQHPDVSVITFTGSNEVGREVNVEAAKLIKRVSLELGGKNAIMVMEDADLDLATDGILWSAFGTSGQRCTAASRVIAHKAIRKQLEDRLVARVEKLRLGDGLLETTDVGPVINQAAITRIDGYTRVAQQEGAKVLVGGAIASEGELAKGSFYRPTIYSGVRAEMRVAQEEIFGPCTSVIEVGSLEEAIQINNSVAYGLSSALYTQDINRVQRAIRDVATGILYINAGTIGAEIQLPFGGTRGTGNGHREAGLGAIDTFTEWKSVYIDYSGQLQRAQIDTN